MEFRDLGLIDYKEALDLQESLVEQRANNLISDQVLFCSHPPVVTLGRSTQKGDVNGWLGDVYEVRRGGRATYHGPSQLVIYPIILLNQPNFINLKSKDVMCFLTSFEKSVMNGLLEVGLDNLYLKEEVEIDSEGRTLLNRGLWWDNKKIAAFGIAVRKWVTYHGCAINLYKDVNAFQGIHPCGYKPTDIGTIQEIGDFVLEDVKLNIQKQMRMLLA